jgi:hypothetical protein
MAATGLSMGQSALPAAVLSAPYTVGTPVLYTTLGPAYGCGHAFLLVSPSFSGKTGLGTGASNSSVRSCAPGPDSIDSSESGFDTNISVRPSNSSVTVLLNWTLKATLGVALHPGMCRPYASGAYCYQRSLAQVTASAALVDLTTGTRWGSTFGFTGVIAEIQNDTTSCSSSCNYTSAGTAGSTTVTRSFGWPLHATGVNLADRFAVELFVVGYTECFIETGGAHVYGGAGSALASFASGGGGVNVRSLSLL